MSARTTVILNARPSTRAREIPVDFIVEATSVTAPSGDFGRRESPFPETWREAPAPDPWEVAYPAGGRPSRAPAHAWGVRVAGWSTMLFAVLAVVFAYVFFDSAETMQLVVAEAASAAFVIGAILAWPRAL